MLSIIFRWHTVEFMMGAIRGHKLSSLYVLSSNDIRCTSVNINEGVELEADCSKLFI